MEHVATKKSPLIQLIDSIKNLDEALSLVTEAGQAHVAMQVLDLMEESASAQHLRTSVMVGSCLCCGDREESGKVWFSNQIGNC